MSIQHHVPERRDFPGDLRLLLIAAIAAVIGGLAVLAARVLLLLIRFFTNLFFYQRFSIADLSPANHGLGAWVIVVPVIGGRAPNRACGRWCSWPPPWAA